VHRQSLYARWSSRLACRRVSAIKECDQVIYVLQGTGTVLIDGWPYAVQPETGVYLRPGAILTVDNPGPEPILSHQFAMPGARNHVRDVATIHLSTVARDIAITSTSDRASRGSGGHPDRRRWYRVLVDDEIGSTQVTQFVGSNSPGTRARSFSQLRRSACHPARRSRMWAGKTHTPMPLESCIYLPQGQITALKIRV